MQGREIGIPHIFCLNLIERKIDNKKILRKSQRNLDIKTVKIKLEQLGLYTDVERTKSNSTKTQCNVIQIQF